MERSRQALVVCAFPSPDLVSVLHALGLGHAEVDESEGDDGEGSEDVEDATAVEHGAEDGEELRDQEGRDPVGGEGPGLGGADGLLADELGRQDERHGTEPDGERDDEEQRRQGRQDAQREVQRHGHQQRVGTHARHRHQQTWLASDAIR